MKKNIVKYSDGFYTVKIKSSGAIEKVQIKDSRFQLDGNWYSLSTCDVIGKYRGNR